MNIALPAAFFALIFLPGVIFAHIYRLDHGEKSFTTYSKITVFAFLVNALLHVSFTQFAAFIGYAVNFHAVFDFLSGKSISEQHINAFNQYQHLVFIYFFLIYSAAIALALMLKSLVLNRCYDILFPWLSLGSEWYAILKARRVDVLPILRDPKKRDNLYIVIDCLVEIAGTAYLYQGIVNRFYENSQGQLETIVLVAPRRIAFKDSHSAEWESIFSRYLHIKYSSIINYNLTYKYLNPETQRFEVLTHRINT